MKVAQASPTPRRAVILGWALWLLLAAPAAMAQAPATGAPAPAPAAPEGRVIDQVVAVIEGQVLTRSELEFETRVALIQRGGVQAAFEPLDEEALKGGLELAINLRLQVLSGDRLEAFPTEQAGVEARVNSFRQLFEGEESFQAFLKRSEADVNLLTEVLGRIVRAERVLNSRILPRAQVSEGEVQRYCQQHESQYPEDCAAVKRLKENKPKRERPEQPTPDEEAQLRIQNMLKRERYDQLTKEDLAQLRASAQVRRVAPFAREARR